MTCFLDRERLAERYIIPVLPFPVSTPHPSTIILYLSLFERVFVIYMIIRLFSLQTLGEEH